MQLTKLIPLLRSAREHVMEFPEDFTPLLQDLIKVGISSHLRKKAIQMVLDARLTDELDAYFHLNMNLDVEKIIEEFINEVIVASINNLPVNPLGEHMTAVNSALETLELDKR